VNKSPREIGILATRTLDLARIARELRLRVDQVQHTLELLDSGNTIPFITRYRKEQTGSLDEEQIQAIQERITHERQIHERADAVLRLIEAQGKLTPELSTAILAADSLKQLDDLYLPFRPKRRTKGSIARERGLEPVAQAILAGKVPAAKLDEFFAQHVNPAQELGDRQAVLSGVQDILAEDFGDQPEARATARKLAWSSGRLKSAVKKGAEAQHPDYRDYFDFTEPVGRIPPHRVMALNRGEEAGALRVGMAWDDEAVAKSLVAKLGLLRHPCEQFLSGCVGLALDRFIQPALEREVRRDLTVTAEKQAIETFQRNLRHLLLQPPLANQSILAIDPGYRTGCKVTVLDRFGKPVAFDVVGLLTAIAQEAAIERLHQLVTEHNVSVIAIGNGTACRETEELVGRLIAERCPQANYVVVNEAGASIYSTSTVAREEFPDLDATARGTVSIGRRLQDPLSELVKIEPQHLGVGLYQHDLNENALKSALDQVVMSCVNYVGVDLNRASPALLQYVSGLNQLMARRVVAYRSEHGPFRKRQDLLRVPGIGPATFTQAAGFLTIDGDDPLDQTWIHPESYPVARKVLATIGADGTDFLSKANLATLEQRLAALDLAKLAEELQVGIPTLSDIVDCLKRPGRDPRDTLPPPVFKSGILKLDDLQVGMELQGTVLNVVDFGAFVDIGLKDSALVHISQMSNSYVKSPHDIVSLGDTVRAWVLSIDRDRKRVGLTLLGPDGA